MFALLLYWTWTSAPFASVPGTACAEVMAMTNAVATAEPAFRARLSAEAVFGIAIDAKTRDCC